MQKHLLTNNYMAVKKIVETVKKAITKRKVEKVVEVAEATPEVKPVYCTSCRGTGRIPFEGFANLSECADCNATGLTQ